MNILKLIGLTFFQLAKQVWLLPQSIALAVTQRRQRIVCTGPDLTTSGGEGQPGLGRLRR